MEGTFLCKESLCIMTDFALSSVVDKDDKLKVWMNL
jgi:hypothetical protein